MVDAVQENQTKWELNKKFSSFKDLEEAVRIFSETNKIHLYKRDARKLTSATNRRKMFESARKELVYYSIKYTCVRGGRTFIQKKGARGERFKKSTKIGCQFYLQFSVSRDGKFLELSATNSNHNHIINELLYKLHPRERRLPADIEKKASDLLNKQISKKILQANILKETGKRVLLKDLYNIAQKFKGPAKRTRSIVIEQENSKKTKDEQKKFRMARVLAIKLADVVSESSGTDFDRKMELLEDILHNWKNNNQVYLQVDSSSNNPDTQPSNNLSSVSGIYTPSSSRTNDHEYAVSASRVDDRCSSAEKDQDFQADDDLHSSASQSMTYQDKSSDVQPREGNSNTKFVLRVICGLDMQSCIPISASPCHRMGPDLAADASQVEPVPPITITSVFSQDQSSAVQMSDINTASTSSATTECSGISLPRALRRKGRPQGIRNVSSFRAKMFQLC